MSIDPFNLGFAPIDQIHEELDELLKEINQSEDEEFKLVFNKLDDHLHKHFNEENKMMVDYDFPVRDCHIAEHGEVLKSLAEVKILLAQGNIEIARKFCSAIEDWFPKHSIHLDSALAHWICKKKFGGKPVLINKNFKT